MRQAPVQRGPDNQVVQIVAVNVTGSNCHSKTLSHLTKKIDFWQNITPNRFDMIFIKSGHLQMAFVQEGFVVNLQEFYDR